MIVSTYTAEIYLMKKPGILMGALVGGLLTVPLIVLFFLGNRIASFPFVPFNVFNNVRDVTPGGIITKVIETMNNTIGALNLGATDTTAKLIEQSMAVGMVLVIGIIAGAIFFAVMRRVEHRQEWMPGALFGLIVGLLLTGLSLFGNQVLTADRTTSAVWLIGLFLLWGYAHNWVYNRLTYAMADRYIKDAPAPAASVQQINRREFLIKLGGATAVITVAGAFVGSMIGAESTRTVSTGSPNTSGEIPGETAANLPNADASVQPAPGTRPELTPVPNHYRIDIALQPPVIDLATWTLPFVVANASGGMDTLANFTMDDIRTQFTPIDQYITQGCISNRIAGDLISTVLWTGVSMQDILATMELPADATHLRITSADGFDESVALDLIASDPTIVMAYDWDHEPLPTRNGFPVRIHIPDHYGMKQPKWITQIEVMNHDTDGYWVRRTWDKEAFVRMTSVIDTVAVNNIVTEGDQQFVPVGGIAWSGGRGISKVEVSVDGGEWAEAQLREPLSDKTWVLWRYDWPFSEGMHTLAVHCYDGNGDLQITEVAPEHPSGATGIHRVDAMVSA
ncbi:MAG: molybdopterin-dependent oxidoreductase [Chloroflexota bacterium]